MKRTSVVVLSLLIVLVALPIPAAAEPAGSSRFAPITRCYPIGSGTTFEVCITIDPLVDCEGWELGPVPPFGYQIWLSDNIYPYGHSLGIAYWSPDLLSGSWTNDKLQETFLWENVINVWIPALDIMASIPVSIAIIEPVECASKVAVCHQTRGSTEYRQIEISLHALEAHLAHGDFLPDPVYGCELP